MPPTTTNDGISLYLSVMEVAENFGLEEKVVGIMSNGGGNIRVCREALELKYTNDSVSPPTNVSYIGGKTDRKSVVPPI